MIPFDFEYYKPSSIGEAVTKFRELSLQGKEPLYYSGGTEIISMGRVNSIYTGAVVDIKGIPECNVFQRNNGQLVLGSALTLTQITEANPYPLLSESAGRVADHTMRDKITLGGNIAGRIQYHEALPPLLVADAIAVIGNHEGLRHVPLNDIWNRTLQLPYGELLVQLIVDSSYTTLPHKHMKRTRQDWIDYPLVSLAAVKKDGRVKVAFSGLCEFPFRSVEVEDYLNDDSMPLTYKLDQVINHLPAPIWSDTSGSAQFREFVLRNALEEVFANLNGGI